MFCPFLFLEYLCHFVSFSALSLCTQLSLGPKVKARLLHQLGHPTLAPPAVRIGVGMWQVLNRVFVSELLHAIANQRMYFCL